MCGRRPPFTFTQIFAAFAEAFGTSMGIRCRKRSEEIPFRRQVALSQLDIQPSASFVVLKIALKMYHFAIHDITLFLRSVIICAVVRYRQSLRMIGLTLPLLLVFSNHQIIQWAILSAALVEVATAFAAAFVLLPVSLFTSATHSVSGKCSCTFRKRHILVNGEMSPKVIPS